VRQIGRATVTQSVAGRCGDEQAILFDAIFAIVFATMMVTLARFMGDVEKWPAGAATRPRCSVSAQ
jgi:hypothetical protein